MHVRDERPGEEFELAAPPPMRFLRACRAVCATTGKRCSLHEHDPKVTPHSASGRAFTEELAPGGVVVRAIDFWAQRRDQSAENNDIETKRAADRRSQRESRARKKRALGRAVAR